MSSGSLTCPAPQSKFTSCLGLAVCASPVRKNPEPAAWGKRKKSCERFSEDAVLLAKVGVQLSLQYMVGVAGFEPAAPRSQSGCASTAPHPDATKSTVVAFVWY